MKPPPIIFPQASQGLVKSSIANQQVLTVFKRSAKTTFAHSRDIAENNLGELKMTTNQENNKLLKEVLRRANKEEKQEYENIGNRQLALAERFLDIMKKWDEIVETEKTNESPKDTTLNDKSASEMSMEEFRDYIRRWGKYSTEYFTWSNRCLSANTEQIKIIGEIMKLLIELRSLEDKEKWLLLSIAIRSQPNLLNYIQG